MKTNQTTTLKLKSINPLFHYLPCPKNRQIYIHTLHTVEKHYLFLILKIPHWPFNEKYIFDKYWLYYIVKKKFYHRLLIHIYSIYIHTFDFLSLLTLAICAFNQSINERSLLLFNLSSRAQCINKKYVYPMYIIINVKIKENQS